MRKVALFIPKLYGGGAERVVSRLSFALSDFYDIVVFVYNADDVSYESGARLINLAPGANQFPLRVIKSIFSINKAIKDNDIELVISFLDVPNIINGIFNFSSKKIVSLRAYYTKEMAKSLKERLLFGVFKYAYRKADILLTLSERQNEISHKEMRIAYEKIFSIDNPFDVDIIANNSRLEIDDSNKHLFNGKMTVAVGRLSDQKNYFELLNVFKMVLEEIPDAKLIILGEGEQRDALEEYSTRLHIDNNIFFLGRVNNPFPYIRSSQVYVSMSKFEGFPNALVESMILGVPVMHSDCMTGPREILSNNTVSCGLQAVECDGGILLPLIDDRSDEINNTIKRRNIADVWIRMLNDVEFSSQFGEKGRKIGLKYDIDIVKKHYKEIIEKVCS